MSVATAELDGALAALRKEEVNVALPGLALAYALLVALFVSPAFFHTPWIFALIWVPLGVLQYRVVLSPRGRELRGLPPPAPRPPPRPHP